MNRNYPTLTKVQHRILLSVLCLTIFTSQAQTTLKKKSKETITFNSPLKSHFNRKTYPKGTGKSFINFGDILLSKTISPVTSFSSGSALEHNPNQRLANQQPVPFHTKQCNLESSKTLNNYSIDCTLLYCSDYSMQNLPNYHLWQYKIDLKLVEIRLVRF